jgi:hypothetical protein
LLGLKAWQRANLDSKYGVCPRYSEFFLRTMKLLIKDKLEVEKMLLFYWKLLKLDEDPGMW